MQTEVLIALVAGGASLFVALISLMASVINSRSTSKTERAIETLRHSLADETKRKEIADEELKLTLEALSMGLRAIQRVKDVLLLILNASNDSLDAEEALSRIRQATDNLLTAYEAGHGNLSDMEHLVYHRAKNTAISIDAALHSELHSQKHASQLSKKMRIQIAELRSLLTECQQTLGDSRTERVIKRTMGV